ncbi:MAG: mechanosensitive ion channel family protein [Chromatiales bacterium]|nr:mechanosensitive ion channel family protein [Chromatiales bacterium]
MDLEQILNKLLEGNAAAVLVTQVFVVVFATLLLDFLLKRFIRRMEGRIEATRILWDDALYYAMRRPLSVLIWLLGVSFAADIVGSKSDAAIFEVINPAREVGVITLFAWFLFRFILAMEKNVVLKAERKGDNIDRTTVDAIGKLLRLSVIITAVLVAMQTLGFSISGILAFGGVGGIAVGFAAKDLLSNFFGGLMIFLDRPFAVGDWIRSPDRSIEGTVEKIGWRLTVIRTFDKRPLYVPNSTFASIAVENPSRMSHRRIYETIGIRYGDSDKMVAITAAVREMLLQHEEIDTSQTLIVNFNAFAPSSLDFFIYTFTKTTNWVKYHEVKQDVLLRVMQIIEQHGAEIAFPTSTVHLADGALPEALLQQR